MPAINNPALYFRGIGRFPQPAAPERYAYHEVVSGVNSPFTAPEEYHNVIAVYSGSGPTDVYLPTNPTEEQRIVTIIDADQASYFNPITVRWGPADLTNTQFVMAKPGMILTYVYDTFNNYYRIINVSDATTSLSDSGYFMFAAPVNIAGIFPFADLISPFGPGFNFKPTWALITKSTGIWTTAPVVSMGTNPSATNIMGSQNLTTAPNVGRGNLQNNRTCVNGQCYFRVITPGAVSSGSASVDIFLRGFWTPQS